jgi:formylglycine-generating enzyme
MRAQRDGPRRMRKYCLPCRLRDAAWCIAFMSACRGGSTGSTDSGGSPEATDGMVAVDAAVDSERVVHDAASGGGDGEEAGVDGAVADGAADGLAEAAVEPPSCASGGAGRSDCGALHESCCATLPVIGTTFFRTYDPLDASGQIQLAPDGGPGGEADPAQVSSFRLDKYLVTVGRFRAFVQAWNGGVGWLPDAGSGRHAYLNGGLGLVNVNSEAGVAYEAGWLAQDDVNLAPTDANLTCDPAASATWTPSVGSNEDLPINCVNWYEAYAFCIWDGGFLPSEAEWVYAAAGGAKQRQYPWGSTAPGTANQYAVYGCYYGASGPQTCTGVANIAPVGTSSLGAGLWGQLDLAGEMWEWNLDGYGTYVTPCSDCALLGALSSRALHAGDFTRELIGPPIRGTASPILRNYNNGLRCARTP